MTTPNCVRCAAPTADGYACVRCAVVRAGEQLTQICDMTPAARDVAHRLSASTGASGGSGKPGSTLPLDLGATARLDAVERELGTWMRHIIENRGGSIGFPPGEDRVVVLARWLRDHLEWMRHRAEVDEFLRDVEACARVVAGVARGPREQKYLGPCGALLLIEGVDGPWPCEGDVYGPAGGSTGTCRTCGAQVDQAERRAWLDDQVRDKAFRAAHIADAYGINVKTIRSWADRGHLLEHGTDRDGRPLYLVGDVLDLAAQAAARRAENEARKAREGVAA